MVGRAARGTVFDIQRYSLHDGPGIRTVVFLKGCPLRCRWCANPESLRGAPQLFYIAARCIRCGRCVAAAPGGGITMGADGPRIDFGALNAAGDFAWTAACPTGALRVKGEEMDAGEMFALVMRDEMFFRNSGGGLTLSGGEPLLQADFCRELLRMARAAAVNTAVETTGHVPLEALLGVMEYVGLFLYDFKCADSQRHRELTGVPNEGLLANLRELRRRGADVMARMPVVPGLNDSEAEVRTAVALLKSAGVDKFALLPFHQYGSGKYASIGQAYALGELAPPDEAHIERLRGIIADAGLSGRYEERSPAAALG